MDLNFSLGKQELLGHKNNVYLQSNKCLSRFLLKTFLQKQKASIFIETEALFSACPYSAHIASGHFHILHLLQQVFVYAIFNYLVHLLRCFILGIYQQHPKSTFTVVIVRRV